MDRAMSRAIVSPPPADEPTMIRMGFVG